MTIRTLFATCCLVAGVANTAMAEPLDGPAIKQLVSGKSVFLSTPYGLEFPLRYNTDGSVSGDASKFSMASMLTPKETGTWWVESDQLCQKWPTWYDGKAFCFTISQTGPSRIAWKRNDGMSGTARIRG